MDRARIDTCAGFTIGKAAEILGVPPSELKATTRWSEELGGQTCRYWSAESLIGPGVQFMLEAETSTAAAAASLASLRRNAPAGDAAIRNTVGKEAAGPAVIAFDDIGDEAMWDALTGTVSLRVANVVASIQASGSRNVASQRDKNTIDLERRVAAEVARGLRGQ